MLVGIPLPHIWANPINRHKMVESLLQGSSVTIPFGPGRKPWIETLSELVCCKTSSPDGEEPCLASAPSSDPILQEVVPPGISPALYQVPSSGLSHEEHDKAMEETLGVLERCGESCLGYATNHSFQLPRLFQSPFTKVAINNGGDPFVAGFGLAFRPKWMERSVLNYYASLWNAKWPHDPRDPESYWGYVLAMGSTEGNTHALWSARNYLSGRYVDTNGEQKAVGMKSVQSKAPVVLFSRNINNSIPKLCNLVNIRTFDETGNELYPEDNPLGGKWVPGVPCDGGDSGPGNIDTCALEKLVDFFSSRGHPIVVVFNYGATVKGSCDDVALAGNKLIEILKKNNMYERLQVSSVDPSKCKFTKGFWFHVDGAFAAAYMPFLEMAYRNGLTDVQPASVFDFRLGFISSIVMSGHKYIGTPWPCGVYLVKRSELVSPWGSLYNGSSDTTLALSRNGHSAILLWSFVSNNSYDAQVATVLECVRVVQYAVQQFRELQARLDKDLWIMHTLPSLSIIFRRPNPDIVEKYTLSCSNLYIDSEERCISQVYVVPHVTTEMIDCLVRDLELSHAFHDHSE